MITIDDYGHDGFDGRALPMTTPDERRASGLRQAVAIQRLLTSTSTSADHWLRPCEAPRPSNFFRHASKHTFMLGEADEADTIIDTHALACSKQNAGASMTVTQEGDYFTSACAIVSRARDGNAGFKANTSTPRASLLISNRARRRYRRFLSATSHAQAPYMSQRCLARGAIFNAHAAINII